MMGHRDCSGDKKSRQNVCKNLFDEVLDQGEICRGTEDREALGPGFSEANTTPGRASAVDFPVTCHDMIMSTSKQQKS